MKYPKSLQDLIESFKLLPGVGPKTAERFAFYTVLKMNKEDVTNLFSKNESAFKDFFEAVRKMRD